MWCTFCFIYVSLSHSWIPNTSFAVHTCRDTLSYKPKWEEVVWWNFCCAVLKFYPQKKYLYINFCTKSRVHSSPNFAYITIVSKTDFSSDTTFILFTFFVTAFDSSWRTLVSTVLFFLQVKYRAKRNAKNCDSSLKCLRIKCVMMGRLIDNFCVLAAKVPRTEIKQEAETTENGVSTGKQEQKQDVVSKFKNYF